MALKLRFNPFTGNLDYVSEEDLSGYFKLDQTTPQTVINGVPIFDQGISANDRFLVTYDAISGFSQRTSASDYSQIGMGIASGIGGYAYLQSNHSDSGSTLPLQIWMDAAPIWTFDTNGNLLAGADGTGVYDIMTNGEISAEKFNSLALLAGDTGFTVSGGTTSKTLTVSDDADVSGTNTGDQDLSGLVPYSGATTDVDLGSKNLTTTGTGTVGSLTTTVGGITLLAGQDIRPSANSTTAINIAQADGTDFVTFDTTNKRVGIGTTGPGAKLDVWDSNFPVIRGVRSGQSVNNIWTAIGLMAEHTGDAGDGFGGALLTQFKDSGGTFNLGVFGFVRDGGDRKGKFIVQNNNGTTVDSWSQNLVVTNSGNVGIGTTNPKAYLHLKAGTATASTAPLKFTTGTSLTAPEAGALEFTTDDLFFTITTGTARKAFVLDDGARLTSGKIPVATTNGRLIDLTAQAHEDDVKTDYTAGDLDTEAEIIDAVNATNAKINAVLAKLETLKLFATS